MVVKTCELTKRSFRCIIYISRMIVQIQKGYDQMDFTAIDFETATSKWSSICSMGICVVKNSRIVEEKEILIRPEPFEFNDYNIYIHGITPSKVKDKPRFKDVWGDVKPYVDNQLIVAHNASFDIGAMRCALDLFGLEYPTLKYICTVKLSQLAYPELSSHKLNKLCEALGITFSHHHAMDDAFACASVLLRIMEDYSLECLADIEECFEIGIGQLWPGYSEPCTKRRKKHQKSACAEQA